MIMSVELTVKDMTKQFGDVYAVKDIEFSVSPGELFALLGPSGAGKTTTVNCIAGIERPDTGDVLIDGVSVSGLKPQERDFAMVFESYALYPHYTVAGNMSFPLRSPNRVTNYSADEIDRLVRETAKMLEIEELLNRYPRELSGGQKQRVGLGRALVRRPRLFLMDEPIAHLDAKLRHHMRGELKKLQKQMGITTILATPDYNEVVAMADRAAILSHGNIEQIGTPIELYRKPKSVIIATTIGDPPINLLDCGIERNNGDLVLRGEGFSLICDGRLKDSVEKHGSHDVVVLGVRPTDMTVCRAGQEGLMSAEVYVFEPLGGEAVATLSIADTRLKVVCPWEEKLKIGEQVGLDFSLDNVYLFDKKTGQSLLL
jgi:multiple sugar transport system ATP-binding protein